MSALSLQDDEFLASQKELKRLLDVKVTYLKSKGHTNGCRLIFRCGPRLVWTWKYVKYRVNPVTKAINIYAAIW